MGSKFIESGNCGVLGGQGELDGSTLTPLDHLGHVGACPMKQGPQWGSSAWLTTCITNGGLNGSRQFREPSGPTHGSVPESEGRHGYLVPITIQSVPSSAPEPSPEK